jgi:hypothetical protein
VAVDWCAFSDGCGGRTWDPAIKLDNGTVLRFNTTETEVGRYGITVVVHRGAKPAKFKNERTCCVCKRKFPGVRGAFTPYCSDACYRKHEEELSAQRADRQDIERLEAQLTLVKP